MPHDVTTPAAELARRLNSRLGDAYSLMDCKRALACCDFDLARAADWLADGHWMGAKLVSWNHESLATKSQAVAQRTGASVERCLQLLKHCAGNEELAQRKLRGLPALA